MLVKEDLWTKLSNIPKLTEFQLKILILILLKMDLANHSPVSSKTPDTLMFKLTPILLYKQLLQFNLSQSQLKLINQSSNYMLEES